VFAQSCQTIEMVGGAPGELLEKFSKVLVESDVSEFAAGEFAIDPSLGLGSSGVINRPCIATPAASS
jgi:hypothetical protein